MYCEAIHCLETGTVRFAIYPDGLDGPRIMGHIADGALHDVFGAHDDEESLLRCCESHFDAIEARALERHREAPRQPVVLKASDFDDLHLASAALCA